MTNHTHSISPETNPTTILIPQFRAVINGRVITPEDGGYGAVGRTVWTELADHFPGRVFAAGRNVKKAETFSQETGGPVWPLKLDIANPSAAKALECARMVVACAEPGDASFAREVLERGIHYVDISASY